MFLKTTVLFLDKKPKVSESEDKKRDNKYRYVYSRGRPLQLQACK